jgi:hypothetical protein
MIYFIRCGAKGPIKIGFSASNPLGRLGSMQTAHHVSLTLVACMEGTGADEKELHARFKHLRLRGEWFRPQPDLVAFIRDADKLDLEKLKAVKQAPPPVDYEALRREEAEAASLRRREARRQQQRTGMLARNAAHERRKMVRRVPFWDQMYNLLPAALADQVLADADNAA